MAFNKERKGIVSVIEDLVKTTIYKITLSGFKIYLFKNELFAHEMANVKHILKIPKNYLTKYLWEN